MSPCTKYGYVGQILPETGMNEQTKHASDMCMKPKWGSIAWPGNRWFNVQPLGQRHYPLRGKTS